MHDTGLFQIHLESTNLHWVLFLFGSERVFVFDISGFFWQHNSGLVILYNKAQHSFSSHHHSRLLCGPKILDICYHAAYWPGLMGNNFSCKYDDS